MTDRATIPSQRPASPVERIFPQVEQERRDAGDVITADNIRRFLDERHLTTSQERASRELDRLLGFLPAKVPTFRSPGMHARHDASLRAMPLRSAPGAAGRDPRLWGAA